MVKLSERSAKAKEKFADALMSVSNSIHSATLIGVLVFPLSLFVSGAFSVAAPFSFSSVLERMSWSQIGLFGFLYLTPIFMGMYAREKAMDLYDEISRADLK